MSERRNGDWVREPPESRLALERRLARDEAVMAADEARLLEDEQRIGADERATRLARRLSVISAALAVALAIALAGLVLGVIALREDVDAIAGSAPENSVGTSSIRDSAVTAGKLADGSVTGAALAPSAVGGSQLRADAVTSASVRRDSLTGADIRESTLGRVAGARESLQADDAARLGGLPPARYLSGVEIVDARTPTDSSPTKGPLAARCPDGTRVVSGGAAVEGVVRDVAIVRSAPDGRAAWAAAANGPADATDAWRLVVTAVCVTGGH